MRRNLFLPLPFAPMPGSELLASAVKRRRVSMGLGRQRFAKKYDFPLSTLQSIEEGSYPRRQEETLFRLDDIFGVYNGASMDILNGEMSDYPPVPSPSVAELASRIASLNKDDVDLLQRVLRRLTVEQAS